VQRAGHEDGVAVAGGAHILGPDVAPGLAHGAEQGRDALQSAPVAAVGQRLRLMDDDVRVKGGGEKAGGAGIRAQEAPLHGEHALEELG
jgi:hypothetical protein